jgi:hypothetical protein
MRNYPLALAVTLLLAGCSSLGLTPPKTLDQQLAYAYGGVTGVLQALPGARQAGTLSYAQESSVNQMALSVRALLDSARIAEASGNTTGAQKDLALATAALTAVQQYLTQHGVK